MQLHLGTYGAKDTCSIDLLDADCYADCEIQLWPKWLVWDSLNQQSFKWQAVGESPHPPNLFIIFYLYDIFS